MCRNKNRLKEGQFFVRISNMGTPHYSVGYECMHAKTPEALFLRLVATFVQLFKNAKRDKQLQKAANYRALLTALLLCTFTPESVEAIVQDSETLRQKFRGVLEGTVLIET